MGRALLLLGLVGSIPGLAACGSENARSTSQKTTAHRPARRGVVNCDLVASPGGTIATPRQLVRSLAPGQVGCLRAGVYSMNREVDIHTPNVTLQSYPGERATWRGRIVILAAGVTIASMNLDGTQGPPAHPPQDARCKAIGGCTLPGLSINGPGARIFRNDITNARGICVNTRAYAGLTPTNFVIERNRIHGCKPANNHIHGIYIDNGNGLIKDNVIYDNGDRGIQLYPNARDVTVANNTIDGNRTNLELGDNASGNIISGNILSNPSTSQRNISVGLGSRFNVEAHLTLAARGNIVTGNCVYTQASGYFGGSPEHSGVSPEPGVAIAGNIVAAPTYVNRAAHTFTLAKGSACKGFGATPDVTTP